jgi:hypothetical protein
LTRLVRIDEEVARFAFEVHLRERCPQWFVAFTNPTAGPWKRVMAPDSSGTWGEVHRFEREELRPDLIVVNDESAVVLIIEAKDDLAKLATNTQASKSVEALENISTVLASKSSVPFWGARSDFVAICGLLWGGLSRSAATDITALFSLYARYLARVDRVAETILGIECVRGAGDRSVACSARLSDERRLTANVTAGDLVGTLAM